MDINSQCSLGKNGENHLVSVVLEHALIHDKGYILVLQTGVWIDIHMHYIHSIHASPWSTTKFYLNNSRF